MVVWEEGTGELLCPADSVLEHFITGCSESTSTLQWGTHRAQIEIERDLESNTHWTTDKTNCKWKTVGGVVGVCGRKEK